MIPHFRKPLASLLKVRLPDFPHNALASDAVRHLSQSHKEKWSALPSMKMSEHGIALNATALTGRTIREAKKMAALSGLAGGALCTSMPV